MINLITVIILSLLVFLVFRKDYQKIIECLRHVSVLGVLLILSLDLGYQFLDSAARRILIHTRMPSFGMRQAAGITFLGIFGNVSTFSAGIIPMQSYYLYQYGVPAGSSIGMLVLIYVFHKITVFLYAAVMMLVHGKWIKEIMPELIRYINLGFVLCALIIIILVLICTWEALQRFGILAIEKLPDTDKWRERKETWRKNLESLYRESRNLLKNHRYCLKLILMDILKLSCLYMIPFWCMRVLELPGIGFWKAQALSSIMVLIAGALPNVAGMGPAELSFMLLFSVCIGRVQATAALVLYRVATYFFPFLISIIVFFHLEKKVAGRANPSVFR
ncbi:MAG: YbhN family protein [Enterocloster sp.]